MLTKFTTDFHNAFALTRFCTAHQIFLGNISQYFQNEFSVCLNMKSCSCHCLFRTLRIRRCMLLCPFLAWLDRFRFPTTGGVQNKLSGNFVPSLFETIRRVCLVLNHELTGLVLYLASMKFYWELNWARLIFLKLVFPNSLVDNMFSGDWGSARLESKYARVSVTI